MRKWVKGAALAVVLCPFGLMFLLEAWYHYELTQFAERPALDAPPIPAFFASAAIASEGATLEPCLKLKLGLNGFVWNFARAAESQSGPRSFPCGGLEATVARAFLLASTSHLRMLDWHLRNTVLSVWVARHMSLDQERAAWAMYGWFGRGNLTESAHMLFGKSPADLRPAEAALLLAAYRRGHLPHPKANRDEVLDRLHEAHVLTDGEWFEAQDAPLPLAFQGVGPLDGPSEGRQSAN